MLPGAPTARYPTPSGAPLHHGQPRAGRVARSGVSPALPLPPLLGPRQGVLRLHVVLRGLAIAHEQRQVVQAQPPEAVPVPEAADRLRQDIRTEVPMMQRDMRHPLCGVIILVDARTEGRQGRPQRRLERAQAGVPCDSHIEDRLQPPGKNSEPSGDHLEGGRVRRERTQDGLDYRHLILFGHMVGQMRKRGDVHALEAELVLQTGPPGGDLGGMAGVEKRDNPVHTFLLSACSWAAAVLAFQGVSAIPWLIRARARPPPTPYTRSGGRWKRGAWACLGCLLPGQGWRDTTPLHAPLGVRVVREHADPAGLEPGRPGLVGSSIPPDALGAKPPQTRRWAGALAPVSRCGTAHRTAPIHAAAGRAVRHSCDPRAWVADPLAAAMRPHADGYRDAAAQQRPGCAASHTASAPASQRLRYQRPRNTSRSPDAIAHEITIFGTPS